MAISGPAGKHTNGYALDVPLSEAVTDALSRVEDMGYFEEYKFPTTIVLKEVEDEDGNKSYHVVVYPGIEVEDSEGVTPAEG